MAKQPSNAVLLEKIENIIDHLKQLNGQVDKNTKFRHYVYGAAAIVGGFMALFSDVAGAISDILK